MTPALLPLVTLLTVTLGAPAPNPPAGADAAPVRARVYVEEVECVTLWRGRHRKTYCRVIRSGPASRRPPAPQAPPVQVPPPAPQPPPSPSTPATPSTPPVTPAPVTPAPVTRAPTRGSFLSPSEARVMRLLNTLRRSKGMRALKLDKAATRVARAHSRDMCRRRYFAHKNPDGKMPWDRLKAGGVRFRAAAENIAAGQRTALEAHRDWNNSPGHRRNRLNKSYRRLGVGVYWCAGVPYWTEVFMQ